VLWHKGKAVLIRKRETFDDLIHNQVDAKELFVEKSKKMVAK
jgi:diaminopimelate decarboxylase